VITTCPLHSAAIEYEQRPAIIHAGRRLSYKDLDQYVTGTASQLGKRGLSEGTRVGLFLQNSWQYVVVFLALIRTGAVACPLSTRLPGKGISARLKQVECDFLITDIESDYTDRHWEEIPPGTVIEFGASRPDDKPHYSTSRPVSIVYTSGSSGNPRAVLHSFGNHYYSALGSNHNINVSTGDTWLLTLPLYHVGGLGILFRCLLAGATAVIPKRGMPLDQCLIHHEITHVSMVYTQLRRLLRDSDEPLPHLQAVLLGGSAVEPKLLEAAHARGLLVFTSYGLTEMASQVTTSVPDDNTDHPDSSGCVLPYRKIKIAEDGEILVKGKTLFQGYRTSEGLHLPVDAQGWFRTGDLGRMDTSGRLTVLGRKDRLFISGGENIQPEEIELCINEVPGIVQAVIVPVTDPEYGYRPAAFIKRGKTIRIDAVVRQLEDLLPKYKIPVAFFDWPTEAAGVEMKINRLVLEELAARLYRPK